MRAHYLVYIISCIFRASSCLKILKSSVFSKHLVKEGHSLSLQCDADAVWFLCVWVSPQGGKMCAIQEEEGGSTQVCQGNPRVTIHGDMNTCSISINNTIIIPFNTALKLFLARKYSTIELCIYSKNIFSMCSVPMSW